MSGALVDMVPPALTEDTVELFIRGRSALSVCISFMAKPGFKDIMCSPAEEVGVFHVKLLDGTLNSNLFDDLLSHLSDEVQNWLDSWSKVMGQICRVIEECVPEGWMVMKNSILCSSNEELRKKLRIVFIHLF